MKSHKLNLFEFRKALSQEKDLSIEKVDVINILTEHIDAYGTYSEIEIKNSLTAQLESFTFLDNGRNDRGRSSPEIAPASCRPWAARTAPR